VGDWELDSGAFRAHCAQIRVELSEAAIDRVLYQLLTWAAAPVGVNELVVQLADLLQLNDAKSCRGLSSNQDGSSSAELLEQIPDTSENVEDVAVESIHRADLLRQAWAEIAQLPPRQRHALLLSLPPDAFQAYRIIVGAQALCECLELTPAQLAALPARLPISDADLGASLGLKRQQVINLRLSARQRLARRLPQP
jgi:hypothetical protein